MQCAFTSRLAEGVCLAKPPTVQKPSTPTMNYSKVRQRAGEPRLPAGPSLNISDVPEVWLAHAHEVTIPRGGKARRGNLVGAQSRLNVLHEDVAHESPEAEVIDPEEPGVNWECTACTFSNAFALPFCEMCGLERDCTAIKSNMFSAGVPDGDISSWPSLVEASDTSWTQCEVSSVGSSWLETRESLLLADFVQSVDASDFLIVESSQVCGNQAPKAPTWAARAAAIGGGDLAPYRPAVIIPALWQQPVARKAAAKEEDDVDDADFLHDRRARPQCQRGRTQHRR